MSLHSFDVRTLSQFEMKLGLSIIGFLMSFIVYIYCVLQIQLRPWLQFPLQLVLDEVLKIEKYIIATITINVNAVDIIASLQSDKIHYELRDQI